MVLGALGVDFAEYPWFQYTGRWWLHSGQGVCGNLIAGTARVASNTTTTAAVEHASGATIAMNQWISIYMSAIVCLHHGVSRIAALRVATLTPSLGT